MERRYVMMIYLILLSLIFEGLLSITWAEDRLMKLSELEMFVDDIPDMPKLKGYHDVNGVFVPKHLKIGMFQIKWKFHRDIPPTKVFAYGEYKHTATIPGPTIEAIHGIGTYVRWGNYLPSKHILPCDQTIPTAKPTKKLGIPTVVHLHGSIGASSSDGHAEAWFTKSYHDKGRTWSNKTYHYDNNQQPGNLWYHDHAMGLTRVNLLAGLIGAYIIRQPEIEAPLGLPSGDEFDQTFVVFDRSFKVDGSLYMNSTGNNPSIHPEWQPEYFGDAIIVNGKAWPRMIVQRKKYRFRIINASNARFFKFLFSNGLDFVVIGSDSVYLKLPVAVKDILLSPSEIVDVVVDFSKSKSDWAILENAAPYPYPSGDPVNEANSKVMKFIIKRQHVVDTWRVPNKLIAYPRPNLSSVSETRYIFLYEYTSSIDEPTHLYINGKSYEAPVTETPKVGATEVWYVINLTNDNHPLHIHLGLFVVIDQTELVNIDKFKDCMTKVNDALKCNLRKHARGKKVKVLEHEEGWKNVYKMQPGFVTKIIVKFAYIHSNSSYSFDATSGPGYAYHCHILDHEDNVMMRPLKLISGKLLEWPKKDKRRFLHVVYRVGDLDRTIKFYTECFGMKLLRKRDVPEEKYTNAFLGFGSEETNFAVELTYNYGVDKYDIGTGFGHFAIATPDVYKLAETIKAKGGNISREPGPVKGGSSVIAFAKDPDGYMFKLIQREATPEPLCQVMLRVGDLDRAIKFYEKAVGMKMLRKIDRPEQNYTLAMMGYKEESKTTVLELAYNYGVTGYTKGNAYGQIAISTQDVYKSGEVVNLVIRELGGNVTRQPGPLPGINTKITAFLDPDGWKIILVDYKDFLKELKKK